MYRRVIIYNIFALSTFSGLILFIYDIPLEYILEYTWVKILVILAWYKLLKVDKNLTDFIKRKLFFYIPRIIIFLVHKYLIPYLYKKPWLVKLVWKVKKYYTISIFMSKKLYWDMYLLADIVSTLIWLPKLNVKTFNTFLFWYFSLFLIGIISMEEHTWYVILMLHVNMAFLMIYCHIRNTYVVKNTTANIFILGLLDIIVYGCLIILIYYSLFVLINGIYDIAILLFNFTVKMMRMGMSVPPRANAVDLGEPSKHFGQGPNDLYFGVGGEFRGTFGRKMDTCNPDMRNVWGCRDEYSNNLNWCSLDDRYENHLQHDKFLESMNSSLYTPEEKSEFVSLWQNISSWRANAKQYHINILAGDIDNPFNLEFAKKDPYYAIKVARLVKRDTIDDKLKGTSDSMYNKICMNKAFKIGYNYIPYINNGNGTYSCKVPMLMYNGDGTLIGFIPPNEYTDANIRDKFIPDAQFNFKGFQIIGPLNTNLNIVLPPYIPDEVLAKELKKKRRLERVTKLSNPLTTSDVTASSSNVVVASSSNLTALPSTSIGEGIVSSQIPKDVFTSSLSSQIASDSVVDPRNLDLSTASNLTSSVRQEGAINPQSSNNVFNSNAQVYGDPFSTSYSREVSPDTQQFIEDSKRINENLKRKFSEDKD